MALFKQRAGDASLPKTDRGSGSLDDYDYHLRPRKDRVVMRLEASDPVQDELATVAELAGEGEIATITGARTQQEDGQDAPIEIRLFLGRRVSGPVGRVPRGLESVYDQAIRRLEDRGDKPRIPVEIVSTKNGLRVDLKLGLTR